jgi:hypothetical protein
VGSGVVDVLVLRTDMSTSLSDMFEVLAEGFTGSAPAPSRVVSAV